MTLPDHSLFDREGAIYMGASRDPNGCKVGLVGVPYDGTTSFRPGTLPLGGLLLDALWHRCCEPGHDT